MRQVEILAPAGSYESLVGAINGGCDAVYLGGSKFGARAFANNLDEETMLRAIDYVHLFDKKIYLTINTLLHNEEIEEELFSYLEKYYMQGLDAVIVQDVGVLSFVHRNFPKLPIHASTQMTFQSEKGGKLLQNYGATRFVTARELSLKEIKQIRQYTNMEIETFVHGALCYCYSGQCFLSSMIGERSGNRGRCAQPCRVPYDVMDLSGRKIKTPPYVLSPKDMCTLDKIPELVDAGIDSFKIEGRMKKPAYAAYTAFLYRKYVDLYLEYGESYEAYLQKHKRELEQDYIKLMDLYNRGGFSEGYFHEHNGPKIMSMVRPNHWGVKVGEIENVQKNRVGIKLEQDLYAQDVLEIRREDGNALYEYTVKDDISKKKGYTETNVKPGMKIAKGMGVFRTRRNALLNEITKNILEQPKKRKVDFYFSGVAGSPMELTCVVGDISITVTGEIVEEAKSQPMEESKIAKQLNKLNATNFQLDNCSIYLNGNIFIPVGQINELRRKAILALEEAIVEEYKRERPVKKESTCMEEKKKHTTGVVVSVSSMEQAEAVEKFSEIAEIYLDMGVLTEEEIFEILEFAKKKVYLIFPAILRRKDYKQYEKALSVACKEQKASNSLGNLLLHKKVKGFVIKNYEGYELWRNYIKKYTDRECILDYNMYTFNREAKQFWKKQEITHSTASIELNGYEWRKNGCGDQDVIIYGHLPLMTSAQCVKKNTSECTKCSERLVLSDRKFHKNFIAMNRCQYCYNQIYDGIPLSLHEYIEELKELSPKNFRLDFVFESKTEVVMILQYYLQRLAGETINSCPIEEYTTGHYRKGVL